MSETETKTETETESEEGLRQVACRRVKVKREFLAHFWTYLLVNATLVAIWAMTGGGYPWFMWPLLGWGIGIAFHGFSVYFGLDPAAPLATPRDLRAIQREVDRLRHSRGTP